MDQYMQKFNPGSLKEWKYKELVLLNMLTGFQNNKRIKVSFIVPNNSKK